MYACYKGLLEGVWYFEMKFVWWKNNDKSLIYVLIIIVWMGARYHFITLAVLTCTYTNNLLGSKQVIYNWHPMHTPISPAYIGV